MTNSTKAASSRLPVVVIAITAILFIAYAAVDVGTVYANHLAAKRDLQSAVDDLNLQMLSQQPGDTMEAVSLQKAAEFHFKHPDYRSTNFDVRYIDAITVRAVGSSDPPRTLLPTFGIVPRTITGRAEARKD
jgi:hypothetical protein